MLLFHIFIKSNFIFIILITIIPLIFSFLIFEYPTAITLASGKILVAEKYGIFLCDSSFSTILKNIIIFDTEDQISTEADLSKVILKRKISYIFGLINYKIYIFNKLGELLYKSSTKIIITSNPDYCTLCPLGFFETNYDDYYYVLGYFEINNNNIYLNLLLYKYEIQNMKNTYITNNKNNVFVLYSGGTYYTYTFRNKGLAC